MGNKLVKLFEMCLIAQTKGHGVKFENSQYGTSIWHSVGQSGCVLELNPVFNDSEYDDVYAYLEKLCV
jgi:hypothetical protein